MKKEALKTLIIMVTAVLTSTATAFANSEVTGELELEVEPAVSLNRAATQDTGSINSSTGSHTGLNSEFKIETNSTETNYDFVMTSLIMTSDGGSVSGFGKNGRLLFAHKSPYPTSESVNNARTGEGFNPNVIAYDLEMTITSPMEVEWKPNHIKYGPCWLILPKTGTEGTLTQIVKTTPCEGTYEKGADMAGDYEAVVTLSIVSP